MSIIANVLEDNFNSFGIDVDAMLIFREKKHTKKKNFKFFIRIRIILGNLGKYL